MNNHNLKWIIEKIDILSVDWKSFLEKLTLRKVPGAGGSLGGVFQAVRTPCEKALWQEVAWNQKCKEASVVKHKGPRERAVLMRESCVRVILRVLWAVEEVLWFYPKRNRKQSKERSNMIWFWFQNVHIGCCIERMDWMGLGQSRAS